MTNWTPSANFATYSRSRSNPTTHKTPPMSSQSPSSSNRDSASTSKGASSPISKGGASAAHHPASPRYTATPRSTQHHLTIPRTADPAPDIPHSHPQGAPTSKGASASLTNPRPYHHPHPFPSLHIRQNRRLPHPLQRATINHTLRPRRHPTHLSLCPSTKMGPSRP